MNTLFTSQTKRTFNHALSLGLLMFFLPFSMQAQKYVNSSTGNDANAGTLALPYKTIQKAVDESLAAGTIEVSSGSYNELVVVNKKVTLKGVGATKPKVNYTGAVGSQKALFQVIADEVEIDNFEMNVDLTKLSSGIVVAGAAIDKITITNNKINPVATSGTASTTFGLRNAISINYAGNRVATGGVDNITVTGNTVTATINDGFGGQRLFRSAVSVDEGNTATYTGNDFSAQNHDITFRFNNGGDVLIQNNNFRGGGVEIGSHNSSAGKVDILNNTFDSFFASIYTSSLRLQYNNQGKQTNISGNTFANHNWGISLENYKSVTINNNTFTPLANSTTYRHITVNTKVLVTDDPVVKTPIDATFTKNTFNGSGTMGGSALSFYNHDNANASFGTFVIGSTGNENTFNSGIANYILLGDETGPTSGLAASYGYTGIPSTTAACWTKELNAEFNKFDAGSGVKLPTAMTGAERTTLETKIYHKPDASCLARVVTFLPVNNTTQATSYVTIAEAILAANPNDVLVVSPGNYSEDLTINKPLIINGANVGKLGTDNTRSDESILLNGKVNITTTGSVVIDGFKLMRDDALAVDVVIVGGGTTATITNNIFERNGSATGTIARAITTSAGAAVKTISNNLFTGTTSGGLFSGHKTWNNAMYVNGATGTVNIQNNRFENNRTALNIDDHQAGIKIEGNTFNNNGTHIAFGGTTPTTGSFTLDANNFLQTFTFINLSNVADDFRLNITSSSYNGNPIASATNATLFTIEAQMYHKGFSSRKGKVIYKANNQYVNNITSPGTKIDVIQNSVKYADANDIINLQGGTYNQRVVVDKSDVTIQGIDADETLQIIDGTGLSGNGDGIQIANGAKNVTIKQLTIQNFSGGGGNTDAGIYAIGGNDGLKVDDVAIKNNVNGSGIYANGPVDGVTITNSLVEGHTTGARGIVIWNGFKQNITITGNTVKNNSCCGIELQDGSASGVTISNNTITDNGDNGIGVIGLTGPLANIISNNTVTNNGRFGIEVKNPNGSGATSGAGSVVIDGNIISRTVPIVDARDIAGIAVYRRGVLGSNVDIPYGVVVSNNTVSGFTQSSTSDGFGIVVEGINHQINNNTVTGNDVGIQRQAGHLPYPADGDQSNLADQYFGRGNSPATCGVTLTGNTLSGNTTATRDVGNSDGTGIVVNTNSGKPFCSIQAAINDVATLNGHVIEVSAGIYKEDVIVSKSLTIKGPNFGISPNTGTRVAEAIIIPATTGSDALFTLQANDVTIDGFKLDGDNPALTSGWIGTNGADIDAYDGVVYYDPANALVVNRSKVQNNIIQNIQYFGVDLYGWGNFNNPSTTGHEVSNNLFKDLGTYTAGNNYDKFGGGVLLYNDNYTHVADNVMTNVRIGVQTGNFHKANPGDAVYQKIENNSIQTRRTGIFYNLHTGAAVAPMTVSNNTITALGNSNEPKWNGMLLASLSNAVGTVSGNTVNGAGTDAATTTISGIEVWNVKNDAPVAISGGSVSNVNNGIFLNNFDGYNTNATDGAHATISGVTITPKASGTGIRVYDNPASTHAAVQATLGADIIIDGGTDGLSVENTAAKVVSPTGNVAFNTQTGNYIKLLSNTNNIDATAATFDGKTGATATNVENFAIEDKIIHKLDDSALGLVRVKAAELFVTTNSGKIQRAVDAATTADMINVNSGTYDEQVLVNKEVTLRGKGATKPIVNFTGTVTGKPTIVDVSANNVTIDSLNFKVDLSKLKSAVIASAAGIDNIIVKDNLIEAYGTPSSGTYGDRNAVSVNYGGSTNYRVATGGVNNVIFTGNTVSGVLPGSLFRAGIAADEAGGTFTGNTLQTISHDIIVRFAGNGKVKVSDNASNGGGMEFADFNAGADSLTVTNNTFNGAFANTYSNALRLKNNYTARPTSIKSNTFSGFVGNVAGYSGTVSLENYQAVSLDGNTFTPLANSILFRHVVINTKEFSGSSGFYQPKIDASITNNTFNGSGTDGGTALTFANDDNDNPIFGAFVVGTVGNENNFNAGIQTYIKFENGTGTVAPNATTAAPWNQDIDATNNKFNGKTGAMATNAENFAIEDKITHKVDVSALGLVRVKAANLFVTTNSGSIQRGVDAAVAADTVNVAPSTFTENITVNKFVKIKGAGISTIVQGVSNTGNLFTYTATASGVDGTNRATLEGMKLTNAQRGVSTNVLANYLTLKDLNFEALTVYGIQINTPNTGSLTDWSIENSTFNATTGAGIQIATNSKVDKFAILNSTFTGNTSGALYAGQASNGLGSFNNVTIIGSNFTTNGAANNQSALYIEKLSNAKISGNTFTDNGISTNPRSMIINLKYNDYANVEFSDNKMNETRAATATSGFGLQLAARNDAPSYNSKPASLATVTITGNEISNFRNGVGLENNVDWNSTTVSNNSIANANTALYGAGANSGLTLQVHNNSFANSTTNSLANGVTGSSFNADCNWFGTTSSSDITAKVAGNVTFIPFLTNGTDDNLTTTGFQPVPGSCNGTGPVKLYTDNTLATLTSSFFTIQAAVDAAVAGNAIVADAGTYDEVVAVNKPLTLLGPNAAISAVNGTRVAEARLLQRINISATQNVTISGFEFFETPATSTWTVYIQGNSDNFTFENNRFKDIQKDAIRSGISSNTANITVRGNLIDGMTNNLATAIFLGGVNGTSIIADNKIDLNYNGTPTGYSGMQLPSATGLTVSGNVILNTTNQGVQFAGTSGNVIIENNVISNTNTSNGADKGAIRLYGTDFNGPITIRNNSLTNSYNGLAVRNGENLTGKTIVIQENDLSANSNASVYNGATSGVLNTTCNWFGTTSASAIAAKVVGNVTFDTYLINGTDNQPAVTGFQPVPNSCTGSAVLITSVSVPVICSVNGSAIVSFSGGTGPFDISWTDGGANTGSVMNISSPYTVAALPPATYSFTVTDANGSMATQTNVAVTVFRIPDAPILTTDNSEVCKGTNAVLSASCDVATDIFRWSTPPINQGNGTSSLSSTGTQIVSTPGTYTGYCTSVNGCVGPLGSITITQGAGCGNQNFITVTPEFPAICPGGSILVTATGCAGTVSWTGPGSTVMGSTVTLTPTATTTYVVSCSTGGSTTTTVAVAQSNVVVTNNISTGKALIKSVDTIESAKRIGSPNVTPAPSVIYEAGNAIILKPGFVAEGTATFKAEIKGCN